ncbi:hypothetical protein GQ457_02G038220 [Hibiscus cannabinus]
MCASLKFLAILICITLFSIVSANRESIGTLLANKPSPSERYVSPFGWDDVIASLSTCKPFFICKAPDPLPKCCAGAKYLVEKTKTKRDEQQLCELLKSTLLQFLPAEYDPKRLPLLGEKCHINFYFPPVTNDTNCYN